MTTASDETIYPHSFYGPAAGPHLLILGAIHGNEKCGSIAMNDRVLPRLRRGEFNIRKGKVTFIPICNPRAYVEDKRFIDANLNRYMGPKHEIVHYEDRLMNQLCPHLKSCDVLVDIHSYTAGGPPFALRGMNFHRGEEEALACSLGMKNLLYGFGDAYRSCNRKYDPKAATGTMEYARLTGAYGVTIECGQHKDPNAIDVAERAIYGAMLHVGAITALDIPDHCATSRTPLPFTDLYHVHLQQVVYKDRDGEMVGNWLHLSKVPKGSVIARYNDGEEVIADRDGVMVMPHPTTPVGTEWWYIGVEE